MRSLKGLVAPMVVTIALVAVSVPARAGDSVRPVERADAGAEWSAPREVPIPMGDTRVVATAISDQGHIAVAYEVGFRTLVGDGNVPGYVIVRRPGGVWGTPHRLNRRNTVIHNVELAFDAQGNLTAFWSFVLGPPARRPPPTGYTVATKPMNRAWTSHVRAGRMHRTEVMWFDPMVLSVAPSGAAVIGWRQFVETLGRFQFTVRVRPTAGADWGPAKVLSSYSTGTNRTLGGGDVAISDDGTAVAAWEACPPFPRSRTCEVQRSTLTRSGTWSGPVTLTTHAYRYPGVEVASTPTGFTAITWVRRHNGRWRTVVALRTSGGVWSRESIRGAHNDLAVGPRGTVALAKRTQYLGGGMSGTPGRVTWQRSQSGWTTDRFAPGPLDVWALDVAVDGTGRIFIPWIRWSEIVWGEPVEVQASMSVRGRAWRTNTLWDWAPHAYLAATAVSSIGRAVAIQTVLNDQETRMTAVVMRVLRPS